MTSFAGFIRAGRDRWAGVRAGLRWVAMFGLATVPEAAQSDVGYRELVGEPPPPTEIAFKAWLDELVGWRLHSVPLARGTTLYFSQAGDDVTGDGSEAAPWRSLDKAQAVLNEHARTGGGAGLALRFRSGDVWRKPATMRLGIEAITGPRVKVRLPAMWVPQPNFFYELRGGGEAERIEARSFDASTGELELLTAPRSAEHRELVMECALMISSPHVTITSFDAMGTASARKPRFTRFVPVSGWEDYRARGDGWAQAYSVATTNPVGWLRTAETLDENFRRVGTVEDVEANPGTWHWDGTRLWAREWLDTPMNGGLNTYEVVWENKADGLCVADVDDVRLDGIVVDGWGMTAQPSGTGDQRRYTGYGIRGAVSGRNHLVVTHCEAYYNNRHCMGNVTARSGGLWTAAWCSWGYCVEGGSAVSYAWGGGNEALFLQCINRAGSVQHGVRPYSGNVAVAGYSHHAHTSGGTNKVALFVSYGCENVPSTTMAGHCGPVDLPGARDLAACRSFVVEDRFRVRTPNGFDRTKPSSTGGTGVLRPGLVSNTTYINCWFEHALLWANGNWVPILDGNYTDTRLFNCVLTYTSLADDYYLSIPNVAWEASGLAAYHCHFDATLQTGRSQGFMGKATQPARNLFRNCILSFRGADYDDPLTAVRLRCVNEPGLLGNNAYAGFTERSGPDGYDADPWPVELAAVTPGARPEAASRLNSVHTQLVDGIYGLEYDREWRARNPVRTAIGPVEGWPALDLPPALRVQIRPMSGFPVISVHASRPCDVWLEFKGSVSETARWEEVGPFRLTVSPVHFIDPAPMTNGVRTYRVRGR